jgi:hypothetical protein
MMKPRLCVEAPLRPPAAAETIGSPPSSYRIAADTRSDRLTAQCKHSSKIVKLINGHTREMPKIRAHLLLAAVQH